MYGVFVCGYYSLYMAGRLACFVDVVQLFGNILLMPHVMSPL